MKLYDRFKAWVNVKSNGRLFEMETSCVALTYMEIVERAYDGYFCRWMPGQVDPTWRKNNDIV